MIPCDKSERLDKLSKEETAIDALEENCVEKQLEERLTIGATESTNCNTEVTTSAANTGGLEVEVN